MANRVGNATKLTVDERVLEAVASGGLAGNNIDFIVERSRVDNADIVTTVNNQSEKDYPRPAHVGAGVVVFCEMAVQLRNGADVASKIKPDSVEKAVSQMKEQFADELEAWAGIDPAKLSLTQVVTWIAWSMRRAYFIKLVAEAGNEST